MNKISEIAAYMKQNPSLRVGLDGYANPRGSDANNLSQRRVDAVRDALIQAGVPAGNIQAGAFGDQQLKRDGRVEVLVRSSN
jgi:outer membrane protein OmpA-like peptidoglycan-associated protein